jgi:hypothetical protein
MCTRGDVSKLISISEYESCDREALVFEINVSTDPIKWRLLTSLGSLGIDNFFRSILTARHNTGMSRELYWGGGRQVGAAFHERNYTMERGLGFAGPGVLRRQDSHHTSWEQLRSGELEPRLPRGRLTPYNLRWDYELACESGRLLVQAD